MSKSLEYNNRLNQTDFNKVINFEINRLQNKVIASNIIEREIIDFPALEENFMIQNIDSKGGIIMAFLEVRGDTENWENFGKSNHHMLLDTINPQTYSYSGNPTTGGSRQYLNCEFIWDNENKPTSFKIRRTGSRVRINHGSSRISDATSTITDFWSGTSENTSGSTGSTTITIGSAGGNSGGPSNNNTGSSTAPAWNSNHSHNMQNHTHSVNHSHNLIAAHTHSLPSHSHVIPAHFHTVSSHTHLIPEVQTESLETNAAVGCRVTIYRWAYNL